MARRQGPHKFLSLPPGLPPAFAGLLLAAACGGGHPKTDTTIGTGSASGSDTGSAGPITDTVLASPNLAGIHFTGSTEVFNSMWKTVGANMSNYKSYPRLVGETGGKDFIVAHPSADAAAVAVAIVRGAFEYQGQKCSAASRAYIPDALWPAVRERVGAMLERVRVGDPTDFRKFRKS